MQGIRLIELKSEIGAGTRGASLGIAALKVASLNLNSNFFTRYETITVEDQNQLLFEENKTPSAIRISGIRKVYESISSSVKETLNDDFFPLVLAADHASAGGTIAGIKMQFPNKRIGVVWIDAHGDMHSPYTSPSGNVHGMPLATALAIDNRENAIRTISEEAKEQWEALKNVGGINPKVLAEDIVYFGVRDIEKPEAELMERLKITNHTVDECRADGIAKKVKQSLEQLSSCDIIYISFDVDSMDSEKVSEGTGTPVPNGFMPTECKEIIESVIESGKVVCLEMVEVNPTLDKQGNKMAETAMKIIDSAALCIDKFMDNEG